MTVTDSAMAKPLVAIIGRPNVGKSTLFNRLVGRREAIVTDTPGTTRDRIMGEVSWDEHSFILVDTGGLEPRPQDPLREKVKAQVEVAVDQADLILFLLDIVDGLTPMDEEIASWLRRTSKPFLVAINKVDNERREASAAEFHKLALGEFFLISAYHDLGIYDLVDAVVRLLPTPYEETVLPEGVSRLAIVGRTNVGKSMLLNAILGQERAIVSEIPGTTRDALDTEFSYDGQPVVLIDTAGIRRPGRLGRGIEYYSVLRAMSAVQRCDVTFLVMDAAELATAQDAHIFGHAWEAYKGMVVVVNKWDLVPQDDATQQEVAIQTIRTRLHFMPYVPICFVSALLGDGISEMMNLGLDVHRERMRRVPHRELQRALMEALARLMPSSKGKRRLTIKGVRQVDINPPTFLFAVNNPQMVHFSYQRYLENRLRVAFGFTHTHVRLVFRRGK